MEAQVSSAGGKPKAGVINALPLHPIREEAVDTKEVSAETDRILVNHGREHGDPNAACTCSTVLPWDSNFCPRHG
jgi:hypothetical protein